MLNGVVLAGGQSIRMGHDKGTIQWHGMQQRDYIANMLGNFCDETYISCRAEQEITGNAYPLLPDTFTGIGPLGAILSAFQKNEDTAWLVLACDLPLIDEATLQYLINNRNTNAIATTFESPHDSLPEPLITIWEPAAFPFLLSLVDEGFKCPRKALLKHDNVTILKAPNPAALSNANTPEDAAAIQALLNQQPH